MTPFEQAKELRRVALPCLAARKPDLQRMMESGPQSPADYSLLVSVLAFALAEISVFEGEQATGIKN